MSGTAADDEQGDEVERTSSLSAPTMLLEGHGAAVNSVKFSSDGNLLASASSDKSVMLWRTFASGSSNYLVLNGHRNAVLELHWSNKDDETLYTASADSKSGLPLTRLPGIDEGTMSRLERTFVNEMVL